LLIITQDYRPGLLSAVPSGLSWESIVLTQTLKAVAFRNSVLADPLRIIAGYYVDQADDIQGVLPVDDEKGCGLAVEI
jgi:hypothetical protein